MIFDKKQIQRTIRKLSIPRMLIITAEFDHFCGGNETYMRTNNFRRPENVNIMLCFSSKLRSR